MIKFACYGGVADIGGNKILVKIGKGSIFLDFGLSYSKESLFFEEFLQPRPGCKIHDLLKLDLLPHIDGVYRQDALCPTDFENYNVSFFLIIIQKMVIGELHLTAKKGQVIRVLTPLILEINI